MFYVLFQKKRPNTHLLRDKSPKMFHINVCCCILHIMAASYSAIIFSACIKFFYFFHRASRFSKIAYLISFIISIQPSVAGCVCAWLPFRSAQVRISVHNTPNHRKCFFFFFVFFFQIAVELGRQWEICKCIYAIKKLPIKNCLLSLHLWNNIKRPL